jgi:hypothetical protein
VHDEFQDVFDIKMMHGELHSKLEVVRPLRGLWHVLGSLLGIGLKVLKSHGFLVMPYLSHP